MDAAARVECAHCGNRFEPDRYNAYHQRYCGEPECRRASKAESQRKWLAKNPDYFRGRDNCARVEHWRADHPYDWRRSRRPRAGRQRPDALQDLALRAPVYPSLQAAFCLPEHGSEAGSQTAPPNSLSAVTGALQDLAFSQHVLTVERGSVLIASISSGEARGPYPCSCFCPCPRTLRPRSGPSTDVPALARTRGRRGPSVFVLPELAVTSTVIHSLELTTP